MTDEKYTYIQDCKDKKITARSARNKRTHNGKGGRVKFPSDYLSKKELKAMNGECKSYRLNAPMSWKEFKVMPDDLKIVYIKALREKYKVPDVQLSEAMGVSRVTMGKCIKNLKLGLGKAAGAENRLWYGSEYERAFWNWWNGVKEEVEEIPVDESVIVDDLIAVNDEPEIVMNAEEETEPAAPVVKENNAECCCETKTIAPVACRLSFEGDVNDILRTVHTILGDCEVHLTVSWDVVKGENKCE